MVFMYNDETKKRNNIIQNLNGSNIKLKNCKSSCLLFVLNLFRNNVHILKPVRF